MKTTLVRTVAEDKLGLQGLLYEPDTKSNSAVLHIHGMTGNFYENHFLDAMSKAYTDKGVALLSVNTRGHGMISDMQIEEEPPTYKRLGNAYEIFADSILDIEAWIQTLLSRGYQTIYLQGHSLGGSKVVYYQAETQNPNVKGLILLSATEMIHYAESNPGHKASVEEAKTLIDSGKGTQLLTEPIWEDRFIVSANTYIDFTTRDNPIDVFKGYDKTLEAPIGNVTVPILAVMGTKDNGPKLIGETSEEYLNTLRSKAKKCPNFQIFVPDTNHGYYQHELEVAEKIVGFIGKP
ncbi:MAG TPA: alpha/beta fold hydrolase [Candidatus Saccharimonadales bacterium]|nr:alpha/beta fold hydrolase [Candidatus Saccharimonadales bacterium]